MVALAVVICTVASGGDATAALEVEKVRVFPEPIRHLFGTPDQARGVLIGNTIQWLDDEWETTQETEIRGEVSSSPNGEYYALTYYAAPETLAGAELYQRPDRHLCDIEPYRNFVIANDGQTVFGISSPPARAASDVAVFSPPPTVVQRWRFLSEAPLVPTRGMSGPGDSLVLVDAEGRIHLFHPDQRLHTTVPAGPEDIDGAPVEATLAPLGSDEVAVLTGHFANGERRTVLTVRSRSGRPLHRHEMPDMASDGLVVTPGADGIVVTISRPEFGLHAFDANLRPQWMIPSTALAPPDWDVSARKLSVGVYDMSSDGRMIAGIARQDVRPMGQAELLVLTATGKVSHRFRRPPEWEGGNLGVSLTARFSEDGSGIYLALGRALASLRIVDEE